MTANRATSRQPIERAQPSPARSYLPAAERRTHLLDIGAALVLEEGWESLTVVELARRAGVSRQLVYQYFGDLENLAVELAERFQDEVYDTAAAAIKSHPTDFAAAMREALERFLVGLREERLAYTELFSGQSYRRGLQRPLKQVNSRKRRRLVELWARYYERVYGLATRDALGLSAFQYDGLRGLVSQVDAGRMAPEEAIDLFIEVLSAGIERLSRGRGRERRTSTKK
jgi:AcrR family transcriptional regulator